MEGSTLLVGESQRSLVYVTGNLGSGKTTLALAISAEPGWSLVPDLRPPLHYLDDLFAEPSRWAFETQIAFLAAKAESVRRGMLKAAGVQLVDRSVYEHFEVFVRAFHETGHIDDRGLRTFARLHTELVACLPIPAAVLLCRAPAKVCEARLSKRGRPTDKLYPPGHVARLGRLLDAWAGGFDGAPVLLFDSLRYDARNAHVAEEVRRDLARFLKGSGGVAPPLAVLVRGVGGTDAS